MRFDKLAVLLFSIFVIGQGMAHARGRAVSSSVETSPALYLNSVPAAPSRPQRALPAIVISVVLGGATISARLRERRLKRRQMQLESLLLERTQEIEQEKTQTEQAREALRAQAVRDDLTGLLNRASILQLLDREMARAIRDKSTLSVVLADLDHFKPLNESHGNAVGDEVLREFSRRIEYAIRSYDAAGRYGGEEFLLVLPSFEGDAGVERLRKIHDTLCAKGIASAAGELHVTCSFGVSMLLPGQYYSAEELVERAEQAMSTAKQDGRNRIGFFARSGV